MCLPSMVSCSRRPRQEGMESGEVLLENLFGSLVLVVDYLLDGQVDLLGRFLTIVLGDTESFPRNT